MTDTRGARMTCEDGHEFFRGYPIPRECPIMTAFGQPCGKRITYSVARKLSSMPNHIRDEYLRARDR